MSIRSNAYQVRYIHLIPSASHICQAICKLSPIIMGKVTCRQKDISKILVSNKKTAPENKIRLETYCLSRFQWNQEMSKRRSAQSRVKARIASEGSFPSIGRPDQEKPQPKNSRKHRARRRNPKKKQSDINRSIAASRELITLKQSDRKPSM